MNDSDEDKHTHNQLEKILIRSEADPPLLLFSKIYSLLGASIDVKCRQRLFRSLVYRYYCYYYYFYS